LTAGVLYDLTVAITSVMAVADQTLREHGCA
jgi:hypothetical protein